MVQELVIYGAGGLGREVALMIEQINAEKKQWKVVGFCDDGIEKNTMIDSLPVIGNFEFLNTKTKRLSMALAIADPGTRKNIIAKITNTNISFPVLVHPLANVGSAKNVISRGSIISAGAILTTNVNIGEFAFINLSATIGHDVSIGAFSALMPGVHVSGSVTIGERSLVGSGAVILQGISVGANVKIGAGAVVTKNIMDSTVVVGIPARNRNERV
jgi:sugar O-acyltransferase (sialic acid O-acetyltransferase NeuD family)